MPDQLQDNLRVPTVMENPENLKPSWKVMEKSWIFVFFQEVMEN